MFIKFLKLTMHNFLSYGHAEIDLTDKGYCLVSGINNCPKDNALSNGSGKSTWTSAINWALTGETIQGVKKNIQNIYIDENSCYVTLEFNVDRDHYVITRYKAPKVDLKIIINGEDKSGKTLTDSENILAEYLPDITTNLIASVIILGQGLPCKFSDNTPSGRKEVLEKLTKSDFMIQDLKDRLNNRTDILIKLNRKYEDSLLANNSQISLLNTQLNTAKEKLKELEKPHNFDEEINKLKLDINTIKTSINKRKTKLNESIKETKSLNSDLLNILNEKSQKEKLENDDFNEFNKEYLNKKYKLESDIKNLKLEIKRLKEIKDICPTCGQKIPGVIKQDTTKQETELTSLEKDYKNLNNKYTEVKTEYNKAINEINSSYTLKTNKLNEDIRAKESFNATEDQNIKQVENNLNNLNQSLTKLELEKENYIKELENIKSTIKGYNDSINSLTEENKKTNRLKEDNDNHLNVLSQMMTLVKRDFRGFLLSNIIDFIDSKAKEYASIIFNTNELDFKLDGNNIDILFCNKMLESLSGGEKQKVNLIIQFAIRDMMSKYLDFHSNILVLDEITDNLDSLGCTNLLNLISTKLNDIESTFIISHHASELEIPSDCEMIVIKDRNGISRIK